MTEPVGIIGLGLLGGAIAERLLELGFPVVGYDPLASQRERLQAVGGEAVDSPAAVAGCARQIFYSLPTSEISVSVSEELLPVLQPDSIILDTTTGHPDEMASLAERFLEAGMIYCEANICGSSEQARRGDVVILAGGSTSQLQPVETLLAGLSSRVFYLDQAGNAVRMKLVVNLVLGLNRAVLAEGLAFASALSLDLEQTLEILQAGPAASGVMQTKGAKMVQREFTPQARLRQHWKDVQLMLSLAESTGIALPFSTLHEELLNSLAEAGYADHDNSSIIEAFLPLRPD